MAGHTGEREALGVGGAGVIEALSEAVAEVVLEAVADSVAALADAVAVRVASDVLVPKEEEEDVAEAVEVPCEEVEAAVDGDALATALGDVEVDTVGVQELAPHCTGAAANPP